MQVILSIITAFLFATGSPAQTETDKTQIATLAGGCFWCTEAVFERVEGVVDVYSGYSGGKEKNPTYRQVSYGRTSHAEAIQVVFDPELISFDTILEIFFTAAHDPTQVDRQGNDIGRHYRSAIYYHDAEQKKVIEKSIAKFNKEKFGGKIATEVEPLGEFWMAEDYHQDYYELNPGNPYIINVARDKVRKLNKYFPELIKAKYRGERL